MTVTSISIKGLLTFLVFASFADFHFFHKKILALSKQVINNYYKTTSSLQHLKIFFKLVRALRT